MDTEFRVSSKRGIAILRGATVLFLVAGIAGLTIGFETGAAATDSPIDLQTAATYAILAGSTITNTGLSVVHGDIGLSPGTSVTGFGPGSQPNGTQHIADAEALQAKADLTSAYNVAAGRALTATVSADLGGQTLVAGVYVGATLAITGTLTLDAQNNPAAVFVFKSADTLITASSSSVAMINGGDPCNVFWQVGSSVTLGTGSTFVGTAMALTSITANTSATITGRLLAQTAAVTLDDNLIQSPACTATPPTSSSGAPSTTPPVTTPPVTTPPVTSPAVTTPPATSPAATSPQVTSPGARTTDVLTSPDVVTPVTRTSTSAAHTTTAPLLTTITGPSPGAGTPSTPTPPLSQTGSALIGPSVAGALALLVGCLLLVLSRRSVSRPKHY
ncbi:MAG: ice-binding family protein [Actinomycetota bacterium]|nr:ice-binding family protein [Actinomycetota bacterium]